MILQGKTVIVTGGAQGLGRLYCESLAQEGANVLAADIRDATAVAEGIRQRGGSAIALKTDVTKEKDVAEMAKAAVEKFGRIDALVNNAAVYYGLSTKHFAEIDSAEWDKVMTVNVKGPWLCVKAVLPQMQKQQSGKIINVSSSTVLLGTPGLLHYVASKAAIIGMTRSMAHEVGDYNICVNTVAPGLTWTEASQGMFTEERAKQSAQKKCLKRLEQPGDLLGVVKFLISDESNFITGQTIVVDGGTALL
jgi:NAD(P)-dependent dehydrogenase (short-subunit alcohol dehydrogenase family)